MQIVTVNGLGSEILKSKCEDITTPEEAKEIANLLRSSLPPNGVGLAAPQIGLAKNAFLIKFFLDSVVNENKIFINPTLVSASGRYLSKKEGCLSVPGFYVNVARKAKVKVKYFDEELKEHTIHYKDFMAAVFQHEYDHLSGVLITDKNKEA